MYRMATLLTLTASAGGLAFWVWLRWSGTPRPYRPWDR